MMETTKYRVPISAVMFILSLVMLVPFLLMILTSFKTMGEIQSSQFVFIPKQLSLDNYIQAMKRGDWLQYFWNSIFVTAVTVIASLLLNSIAGYSFGRLRFKGRDLLFVISLVGLMIPPQVTMIPVFLILKHIPFAGGNDWLGQGGIGWINSYMGLIVPYVAGSFGVFLFRQFYLNFPKDLDDAAKVDGLSAFKTYLYIYVPLSKPIFATLIALKATQSWNEYTWPLIVTNNDAMKTVQLALTLFRDETQVQWNLLMSATTLIVLPLMIVFLFSQKYFIEGIVTSGIKG
ncbi:carbohydrate ABC transporter permease [Paenibacillus radicis (ex Xue et al. 2023)]|uniref:Carbohydrate ABC transporter permease n=1 Tax=Paenibacillus radicis (ex Xue et al. 2023) TaxID=2972489 RepID=A0ABT1YJ26_9BACL|nr:carbohydrate ABC transporter permease [Paenibacillus radicis (ex Xue et al. 2023)]MCR8633182.1 carbohydrate ABC transporter permease [Paenibacillus radicis (ex Xue et al. 2023)]